MAQRSDRARYDTLQRERPDLFLNPSDAPYLILTSPDDVAQAETQEASRLRRSGMPASWSDTGVVYEDAHLLVLRDAVRRPDGTLGTYVRTVSASSARGVAVLPLLGNEIILIRHFRPATRTAHLEIPRGFGQDGLTSAEQASVELREEIGAAADELIDLGSIYTNTGLSADPADLFLARIQKIGDPQIAEGISRIEPVSLPGFSEMIASGEITDAFTITAYARASLRGLLI